MLYLQREKTEHNEYVFIFIYSSLLMLMRSMVHGSYLHIFGSWKETRVHRRIPQRQDKHTQLPTNRKLSSGLNHWHCLCTWFLTAPGFDLAGELVTEPLSCPNVPGMDYDST